MSNGRGFVEQADGKHRQSKYHGYLKRAKNKAERRRARQDPEAPARYGKYKGWET